MYFENNEKFDARRGDKMNKLHLHNIEYEWNEETKWTNDQGQTFSFASLKKTITYKGNKKYQNLTVKPEHIDKFKGFLKDIISGGSTQEKDEDDIPY